MLSDVAAAPAVTGIAMGISARAAVIAAAIKILFIVPPAVPVWLHVNRWPSVSRGSGSLPGQFHLRTPRKRGHPGQQIQAVGRPSWPRKSAVRSEAPAPRDHHHGARTAVRCVAHL